MMDYLPLLFVIDPSQLDDKLVIFLSVVLFDVLHLIVYRIVSERQVEVIPHI